MPVSYSPRAADGRAIPTYPAPGNPRQADYQARFTIQRILDLGMHYIGTPYVWGGAAPGGFDCSGLIQFIYGKHGVKLPRVSRDQANAGRRVSARDARPGDLIAFDYSSARAGIDHIGIYLGGGKMLHAPRKGRSVEVVSVNLAKAAAITRVASDIAYESMRSPTGQFVYTKGMAAQPVSAAGPSRGGTAAGGGDPGSRSGGSVTKVEDALSGMGIFGGGTDPTGKYRLEDYGFSNAFFSSDPKLKALVDRAVAEQWTPEKFAIELRNTDWYRTKSEAQRQWTIKRTGDPATANRMRAMTSEQIKRLASQMGARIGDSYIKSLTEHVLTFGYTEEEIRSHIAPYVKLVNGEMVGDAGKMLDVMRQRAHDFGVTVGDDRLAWHVQNIARGKGTEEDLDNWLKAQAKALYPGLAKMIDAGVTVEDVAQQYKQAMAQILEVDVASIDLRKDPHLRKALTFKDSSGKGEPAPMALYEFERMLRNDPRWMKTSNARSQLSAVTNKVMQDFGFGV